MWTTVTGAGARLALLGLWPGWAVAILAFCRWMQGCGGRKLVIQGG